MRFAQTHRIGVVLFMYALLFPQCMWASIGMLQVGYGVKAQGMGGVGTALPLDSFAVAYNPAGLPQLCRRLDLGFQWPRTDGQYWIDYPEQIDQKQRMVSHAVWPEGGVVLPLGHRFTAGVALYAVGGWKTHYKQANPLLGTTPLGSTLVAYSVTPALAWQLTSCQAIGIGVNVTEAHFQVKGFQSINPEGTNLGFSHTYGASVRIGWFATPVRCMSLGVTYQTPTWMGRFSRYRTLLPEQGRIRLPSQLGAGFAWRFHPLLTGSADILKVFWRDAPLWRAVETDTPQGFGWRNQLAFKFGLAWNVVERLIVRIGYAHADAPIFPSAALLNTATQAIVKDTITAGITICIGCNELSFSYVHGLGHHVTGDTLRDNVPEPEIIDTVRLRSRQDAFGFSYGRRF